MTKNVALQGDEEIIEKLMEHLELHFPRLKFQAKTPLKELFIKPRRWLRSMWARGHADISVFRHGQLVCIVEPGGYAHFKDLKQRNRDKRKDKLCSENRVNILRVANSFVNHLEKGITKKLLKKYFYGNNGIW